MNERNEFLSLRQQLETLMIKRDQSKRELVEKEEQLAAECRKRQALQEEIEQMHRSQAELNEKYELVRECTVEELENLIFGHNSPEKTAIQQEAREEKRPEVKREDSTEIQHEYLKNVLVRYIKAETSGGFDQALMLL
jgi:tRNA U34 2-thiouridine synthase MnmA/TrmU